MTQPFKFQALRDRLTGWATAEAKRETSRFKSTWDTILRDLAHELRQIEASDVVLSVVAESPGSAVRIDGGIRAGAKIIHPGVRLTIGASKQGPLVFDCDTYQRPGRSANGLPSWQHNLRAISKTLEALRAVDRYGASQGRQYAGWAELEATTGGESPLGQLAKIAGVNPDGMSQKDIVRAARRATHPDRGGSHEAHLAVNRLVDTLPKD